MELQLLYGLLLPLAGTTLGGACVFFIKGKMNNLLQRSLTGFAAGVMMAASIWSLIIPSMEMSSPLGELSWLPAAVGFWVGILFLLFLDMITPHLHLHSKEPEGPDVKLSRTSKMILAVTLHNIPEGMAIGAVYAGWMSGSTEISVMGALALSIGIAIQNFPEGAIVSLPLVNEGVSKPKAFLMCVFSGIVEPLGALLTIWAATHLLPFIPYCLSFAAGAMVYVIVEELIPEMSEEPHSNIGTIFFGIGFTLMMILDVALG